MKTLIISFVLIVIVQLSVPLKMIHDKQSPLIYGQEFTFKTEPIDPYDPFRGKYVTLSFSDNYLEMDEYKKWKYGETVYVQFFEGEDGFAKIKSILYLLDLLSINHLAINADVSPPLKLTTKFSLLISYIFVGASQMGFFKKLNLTPYIMHCEKQRTIYNTLLFTITIIRIIRL